MNGIFSSTSEMKKDSKSQFGGLLEQRNEWIENIEIYTSCFTALTTEACKHARLTNINASTCMPHSS